MGHLPYESPQPPTIDTERAVVPQRTSKGLKLQMLIAGAACVPLVVVLIYNVGMVLGGDPLTPSRVHAATACGVGLAICFCWLSVVKLVAWWRHG